MRVAEKQYGTIGLKTPIGIMDLAFTGCKANFVKILAAVHARSSAVLLDLKHIEPFQLQLAVELGYWSLSHIFHFTKLRFARV